MKLSELLLLIANKTGAVVNVEALHPAFFRAESLKLTPEQYLHYGAYCTFAKREGAISVCSLNKKRSLEIASSGRVFWGTCPHGVWDMAQPVMLNGELAAVVYLGHFSGEMTLKEINGQKYSGHELLPVTDDKIKIIRKYGHFISDFILIEIEAWLEAGGISGKQHDEAFYFDNCMKFIEKKYCNDISLNEFADMMKLNPNYLGGIIKNCSGRTFRQLLNKHRIEASKTYLRLHHDLNISQIAYMCGFNDSNYFSTVFRKLTGFTPKKYRK